MFNQDLNWEECGCPGCPPQHTKPSKSWLTSVRSDLLCIVWPKQNSKNTCQMLPHLMPQQQESLRWLCLCLPNRTRSHSHGCTEKHQNLHLKPKTKLLQIKLKKVIVSILLRLFQYYSSSSGLSRWGRCFRCLQDTALRSSETFTGFKPESFSRQSKSTGHNPRGIMRNATFCKKH